MATKVKSESREHFKTLSSIALRVDLNPTHTAAIEYDRDLGDEDTLTTAQQVNTGSYRLVRLGNVRFMGLKTRSQLTRVSPLREQSHVH